MVEESENPVCPAYLIARIILTGSSKKESCTNLPGKGAGADIKILRAPPGQKIPYSSAHDKSIKACPPESGDDPAGILVDALRLHFMIIGGINDRLFYNLSFR